MAFVLLRKRFFFEKKKQKTFAPWGLWQRRGHGPRLAKVFLPPGGPVLFFQKKKRLLVAYAQILHLSETYTAALPVRPQFEYDPSTQHPRANTIKILHLTDLHLRPAGRLAYGKVDSNEMASRAFTAVAAYGAKIDAVIVTGDLADCGLTEEYAELARRLTILAPVPVYLIPGNHDRREAMRAAFPALPEGAFIQYAIDDFPARLVMLDTVVAGATHGHLCEARLDWLRRTLAERPERDTMIAMHHPPLATGIAQYDRITLDNRDAFRDVIAANPQVSRIICGHHHRMISGNVAQATCIVAPAIAYQFELPHDPAREIGFVLEPSMFLLHDWAPERGFITHAAYVDRFAGPFPVLLEPEYPGD